MADLRVQKYAKILVEHSTRVVPGDRILIEATVAAEPLVRETLYSNIGKRRDPHPMIALPGMMPFSQDEMYLTYAKDTQLDFVPTFYKLAYDQFEGRIRIHSATNTRGTTNIDPLKVATKGQSTKLNHGSPDAARRRRQVQVGHHALPHRWLCTRC